MTVFSICASRITGKERDAESGLDYFGARYYGSNMGRFSSPDPSGLYFSDPTNPQSLNLYAYALNRPLVLIDPNGLSTDCDGKPDPSVVCLVTSAWDWLKSHLGGGSSNPSPAPDPQDNPEEPGGGMMPNFHVSSRIIFSNVARGAPNSGLTTKQAACAADAAINGALSIFVPGYAATKALASFGGFSFNPVGALTGTSGLFSAGNPTPLQTVKS